MPVLPIPRRARSFHGPHATCLLAAPGPLRPARTALHSVQELRARWLRGLVRLLLCFGCSLLAAALCALLALLLGLQYLGVRALLRLQLWLSLLLPLLGRRRLDFRRLNQLLAGGLHVTLLLVGGLGWCFLVFVDM